MQRHVSNLKLTSTVLTTFTSTRSTPEPTKQVFKVPPPSQPPPLPPLPLVALCCNTNFVGLTSVESPPDDVANAYPGFKEAFEAFSKLFRCKTRLCGQTCVYLACGEGKEVLKGKYFDCEQDIGTVVAAGPEEIRGPKQLYELKVEFLGGLPNDGGTVPDDALQNKDGALATQ